MKGVDTMKLIDVWNISYNCQLVLIRLSENKIFEGFMEDVPMKFMEYKVIGVTSVDGVLIIDIWGG